MMTDAQLARACADAYLPDVARVLRGGDLAANVVERDDEVVVALRGTTDPLGWLRDLDALPMHGAAGLSGIVCHRGFLDGAVAVWHQLDLPTGKMVTLAGHSLGGAMAVILCALRVVGGDRVDRLVTFGAPRAGYQALADLIRAKLDPPLVPAMPAFKEPIRQYRRGNDPVPGVPFDLPAFPYKHVVALTALGADQARAWDAHSIRGYLSDLGG